MTCKKIFLVIAWLASMPAAYSFAQNSADKVSVSPSSIEKAMPSYNLNLRQLIDLAEKNIKLADQKIAEQEKLKADKAKEAQAKQLFEEGNSLYRQGKLKEAKTKWNESLSIATNPTMRNYLRQIERQAEELKQREILIGKIQEQELAKLEKKASIEAYRNIKFEELKRQGEIKKQQKLAEQRLKAKTAAEKQALIKKHEAEKIQLEKQKKTSLEEKEKREEAKQQAEIIRRRQIEQQKNQAIEEKRKQEDIKKQAEIKRQADEKQKAIELKRQKEEKKQQDILKHKEEKLKKEAVKKDKK